MKLSFATAGCSYRLGISVANLFYNCVLSMLTTAIDTNKEELYRMNTAENLLDSVSDVNMIVMPRGLCLTGYSQNGEVLMVDYEDHPDDLQPWINDFYEHHFLNRPLLTSEKNIGHIFIATEKSMIVPAELYDKQEAEEWLRTIHFIEADEEIEAYQLKGEDAWYVYAYPTEVKGIINRYYGDAEVHPLATYQLCNEEDSDVAYCCLMEKEALVTIYVGGKLHGHKMMPYNSAEDIAYHLLQAAKDLGADAHQMTVYGTAVSGSMAAMIPALQQYIPDVRDGSAEVTTNDPAWAGTIHLLKLLHTCVS